MHREHIRVAIRIRPEEGDSCLAPDAHTLAIRAEKANHKGDEHSFKFDEVLPEDATQERVFSSVKELVTSSVEGYNVSACCASWVLS